MTLRALESGQSELRVRDNGVGFPLDVDFRETESLGLQLVTSLTEQIEGSVELERNPEGQGGTQWTITIPPVEAQLLQEAHA